MMGFMGISDDLASPIRENVLELLGKPNAGSRAFKYNSEDAVFLSNCHGTMAYIFGLEDSIMEERGRPGFIYGNQMKELIEKYFLLSDNPNVGDLIGFYETSVDNCKFLLHTALLIGENEEIFYQSGTGGIFESEYTIEQQKRFFISVIKNDVEIKSYKIKGI